tara:strand:+ start:126 stop:731 length:606 start_codon:yes stop_codon:yes gene_type:complete
MITNQILKLFPEPIFKYKFDNSKEINTELSKYIYDLRDKDTDGVKRSNKGGWHSQNFKLTEKNSIQLKFALKIQPYIIDVFQNFGWKIKNKNIRISEMWAIINKKDDFNVIHTHPNCYLSAAYYVKAGKDCGKFEVEHPNNAKKYSFPEIEKRNELNLEVASIEIEEGDLLLFPSYLPHKVSQNNSNDDRIVISFNVDITK